MHTCWREMPTDSAATPTVDQAAMRRVVRIGAVRTWSARRYRAKRPPWVHVLPSRALQRPQAHSHSSVDEIPGGATLGPGDTPLAELADPP